MGVERPPFKEVYMDNTIIQQGTFSGKGKPEFITLRSDIDWMRVYNFDNINTPADDHGVEYYWQRGMDINEGFVWLQNGDATAITVETASSLAVPGFTLFDSSVPILGDLRATTGITAGPHPTVSTADTANLVDGDVVRLYNTAGAEQLGAMDFTINEITGGSFDLAYMRTIIATAGAGSYRRVQFGTSFYPSTRFITRISNENQALVTLSVDHGFTVGQVVRFIIPTLHNSLVYFGMAQLNELQGAIVEINEADADGFTNTIRVNIDTSMMMPFNFPLSFSAPFSPALVVPVGEDTGVVLANGAVVSADSTINNATIGMILGFDGGFNGQSPAGAPFDVMLWTAGKSFSVDNKVLITRP